MKHALVTLLLMLPAGAKDRKDLPFDLHLEVVTAMAVPRGQSYLMLRSETRIYELHCEEGRCPDLRPGTWVDARAAKHHSTPYDTDPYLQVRWTDKHGHQKTKFYLLVGDVAR